MFARLASRIAMVGARQLTTKSFVRRTVVLSAVTTATVTAAYTQQNVFCAGRVPPEGLPGTNQERTFIAIKPDGVQRQLIAKIIQRFEEKGFQLVALKLIQPTPDQAAGHYDDLKNKPFFPKLTKFFSSGPVVAMVWQGKGAILTGRKLLGETDPAKSAPGSIRGDFSIDIGRNIIHGSDGPEGAAHEIAFWFRPDEIVDWTPNQDKWIYEQQ